MWRWRGDPALSPQLVELVEARIGSLPVSVNRVLELLAYGLPVGGVVGFLRAHVAMARGRLRTARRALHDVLIGLVGSDPAFFVFWSRLRLVQVLGMAGDAPGAAAVLADIEADPCPQLGYNAPAVHLARAWAAAEGATSEALRHARTAADTARDGGQPAVDVLALLTAVQFGDQTVAERLGHLATQVDGPAAVVAARHAAALADSDGPGLQDVSRRWEQIGALLVAADASAQASGAFRRAGLRGSAAVAAARAHDLAQRCEGADTPALRSTAAPLPLTEREREIASLVAAGLTNRAIADRLVVSVRTIEGHVLRACRKLDLPDRAALRALLGR